MPGAGIAIVSMINSLKNNKKLLRAKRLFLNQSNRVFKPNTGKIVGKAISAEELKNLKSKIVSEEKSKNRSWIVVLLLFVGIAILIFGLVIQKQITFENQIKQDVYNTKKAEYLELIADGDNWLAQRKWHNAIFQYKKAKEIFPKEFDIHYRLAYAYSLRCEDEFLNCNEAKKQLDKLLEEFPEKSELENVKKILVFEYQ